MKNKLMAVLLLLSQIVIASPTKLTKEDFQKTIADFYYSKITIPSRIVAYQSPLLGKNSDDVADSQQSGDKKQINWDASKYHKFEVPFPNCAPERMSLFSSEELRNKHRSLPRHGGYYLFMPGTVMSSAHVYDNAHLPKPISSQQVIIEDQEADSKN